MKLQHIAAIAVITAMAQGCRPHQESVPSGSIEQQSGRSLTAGPAPIITDSSRPAYHMPRAVIYRTSAPSDSLVPVTIENGRLVSFPAPSDLGEPPVRLDGGWYLDSRGVSLNSVFTRYTYTEYKALPQTPSPEELIESSKGGPRVTDLHTLPVAVRDVTPEIANRFISELGEE